MDRNSVREVFANFEGLSLSARRAWIEIAPKENATQQTKTSRSPQGERG